MSEEKLNNLSREEAIKLLDNQIDYTYKLTEEIQHLVDILNGRDKEYKQLRQENQQLKEDYDCAFQDAEELNQRLTEVIDERNNLLSVLDEIRAYIKKDYSFAKRGDIPLLTKDEQLAGKLFEILDKVKQ